VTRGNHEFNKRFCLNCKENKEIGHLCYVIPLKNALPPASDKVLYVFYDFERTKKKSTQTRLSYTYRISSACSISVHGTKT